MSSVVLPSAGRTYEMFPHDRAKDFGTATKSSLQMGTISTEYVNL